MDRAEHLDWCKQRALEYVDNGDMLAAFASFQQDMGNHSETANHLALEMGSMLLLSGDLSTAHQMREWIEGVN